MGAVSQFAAEPALPSSTSEGGRWYSYCYSVLGGRGQRKATSMPARSVRHVKSVGEIRKRWLHIFNIFLTSELNRTLLAKLSTEVAVMVKSRQLSIHNSTDQQHRHNVNVACLTMNSSAIAAFHWQVAIVAV